MKKTLTLRYPVPRQRCRFLPTTLVPFNDARFCDEHTIRTRYAHNYDAHDYDARRLIRLVWTKCSDAQYYKHVFLFMWTVIKRNHFIQCIFFIFYSVLARRLSVSLTTN